MRRFFFTLALVALWLTTASRARADKVALLPFSSTENLPRTELEEVRKWTRDALTSQGHVCATADEMVSAESAVKDGVADTTQEYRDAATSVGADWAISARVERKEHPANTLLDGRVEDGFTTYRVELEAYQASSGRVESLSREVLPDEGVSDIAEMVTLLVRPQGVANAELPWSRLGPRRPKPRALPPVRPPPPEPPPPPSAPASPPRRYVYGEGRPFALGASIGVTNAMARPEQARGPSWAMPIGGVVGYALEQQAPGLELRGVLTSQVLGPKALELSAGARYAISPIPGVRVFVGPELLLGAHVALGAHKTTRFLTHGALFLAVGITESLQVELAGDLSAALGGGGTLLLGGGTARALLRF